MTSVTKAVNDAFEFYTTDQRSSYHETFEKGSVERAWSAIYAAQNEYYYISEDETPRFRREGYPLFEKYSSKKYQPFQIGYMYNGFYKVFIASTAPKTWTIKKFDWEPDKKDRKELWIFWTIVLTVLLFIVIIPLWLIDNKKQKVKNESLYDRLKRLCYPANFIKEYDKKKVDAANIIYKKLSEISVDDKDILEDLELQAIKELGISLIDAEKLAELKDKVNPKNYMNPYNAEKVAIANELYSILSKDTLTYAEMANVEAKSKQLLLFNE